MKKLYCEWHRKDIANISEHEEEECEEYGLDCLFRDCEYLVVTTEEEAE